MVGESTVNVPLILAIINIDRAVSNPVVHTQRDEMILEDGRTETPCSLNETSSKFRVVACADGCMYVCTNLIAFKLRSKHNFPGEFTAIALYMNE